MGIIGLIVLIVAAYVAYKFFSGNDTPYVKDRIKGRPEEQKKVIRYFCNDDGCFSKNMKDAEYEAMVQAKIRSMDFKKRALDKIGLDESELTEIDPVNFHGYLFDNKKTFSKYGADNVWRSSAYQISWLFFSASQVYLYQYMFNMDEDGKKESTEEFFYKDITNFSTSSDTIETPVYDPKKKDTVLKNVDTDRFALTVPGEKFYCSMSPSDHVERAIQGMKAKLREKKNA